MESLPHGCNDIPPWQNERLLESNFLVSCGGKLSPNFHHRVTAALFQDSSRQGLSFMSRKG